MTWHFDGEYHVCEPCNRDFNTYTALMCHLTQSSRHNYCVKCDRDFGSHFAREQHYIDSSRHYWCGDCQEAFDDGCDYDDHMDNNHIWCPECGIIFRNDRGLHEHRRQSHEDRYCTSCQRMFKHHNNLNAHMNSSIHKSKNNPCMMRGCSQTFVSHSAVVLHLESGACVSRVTRAMIDAYVVRHDVNRVITNPNRMITDGTGSTKTYKATDRAWNGDAWECYFCSATFSTRNALNIHLASPKHLTAQSIYRCPNQDCGTNFKTLSGLGQHIESGSCGVNRFRNVQHTIDNLISGMRRIAF